MFGIYCCIEESSAIKIIWFKTEIKQRTKEERLRDREKEKLIWNVVSWTAMATGQESTEKECV